MKKEIIYRLVRIMLALFILITFTLMRENTKESYEQIEKSNLLNNFQITNLTNVINQKEEKQENEKNSYTFQIKNMETKPRKITFKIENNGETQVNNKYVKYQIIKDNKEVITASINDEQILYEETIQKFTTHTYEIKFWIETNQINNLEGESFNAKLKII